MALATGLVRRLFFLFTWSSWCFSLMILCLAQVQRGWELLGVAGSCWAAVARFPPPALSQCQAVQWQAGGRQAKRRHSARLQPRPSRRLGLPNGPRNKAASILGTMLVHLPIEPWARVCARSPPSHPLLGRAWRGGQTHGPRLPSLLPSPRQAHGPILLWAVHCDTQPRQAQPTPRANK